METVNKPAELHKMSGYYSISMGWWRDGRTTLSHVGDWSVADVLVQKINELTGPSLLGLNAGAHRRCIRWSTRMYSPFLNAPEFRPLSACLADSTMYFFFQASTCSGLSLLFDKNNHRAEKGVLTVLDRSTRPSFDTFLPISLHP
jgi:hypothetical protein